MEKEFYDAVNGGKVEEVKEILRSNPNLKINWKNEKDDDYTALIIACENGHDSIVRILLAHPDIDVNVKNGSGYTPFNIARVYGRISCVRLLLRDSRVNPNEPDYLGHTPLWSAAGGDHLDFIEWWIASGREMDLGKPGDVDSTDAISRAKKEGKTEIATLLERFKSDAAQTRHAVRVELGFVELAAEVFALVVFVSDGLLQIKYTTTATPAARFFSIAGRLPLELQMMLCFRQVGSAKEINPGKKSEVAFKELARRLMWSSFFAK